MKKALKIIGKIITFIILVILNDHIYYEDPIYIRTRKSVIIGYDKIKCEIRLRNLRTAVACYNEEHEDDPMTDLDINLLLKEKYLKEDPNDYNRKCIYSGHDITDATINENLVCSKHGNIAQIKEAIENQEKNVKVYKIIRIIIIITLCIVI